MIDKINVRKVSSQGMGANCYIVNNGDKYIIIDPCVSFNNVKSMIDGKVMGIFLTHGHFDHFDCIESYLNNLNDVIVYGHKRCFEKMMSKIQNCSYYLGQNIEIDIPLDRRKCLSNESLDNIFDNYNINVIETFGHTDCCLSYIIDDIIFTGDFLFKQTVGRTDLHTGSMEAMKKSLNEIKKLTIDYLIYPGHGDFTTLNDEKKNNHYMR